MFEIQNCLKSEIFCSDFRHILKKKHLSENPTVWKLKSQLVSEKHSSLNVRHFLYLAFKVNRTGCLLTSPLCKLHGKLNTLKNDNHWLGVCVWGGEYYLINHWPVRKVAKHSSIFNKFLPFKHLDLSKRVCS